MSEQQNSSAGSESALEAAYLTIIRLTEGDNNDVVNDEARGVCSFLETEARAKIFKDTLVALKALRSTFTPAQPARAPMPVKHYTGMPGALINGEVIYDWLMDDGSVEAMTASDVVKRRASQPSPAATVEINQFETTKAGVIDWKMEAERANRLLSAQSRSSAGNVQEVISKAREHLVKTGHVAYLDKLLDGFDAAADAVDAALAIAQPQGARK